MTAPSTIARDNANSFEAVKHGQRQLQGTDWAITFKVAQSELIDTPVHEAPNGTRYMVALVEVADDEQPVVQTDKVKGGRLAQQAGIACGDKRFWAFLLEEENGAACIFDAEDAARHVKRICGISSRAQLDHDEIAAAKWRDLHEAYQAWLVQ